MYDFENRLVQAGAGIAIVHDGDANRVSASQQRATGGPSVSLPNLAAHGGSLQFAAVLFRVRRRSNNDYTGRNLTSSVVRSLR